ncbi:uncharacterized protein LOC120348288 [Styela clava]
MNGETYLRPCVGDEDWIQTRECFIRAFISYPLYVYMIPNANKRPEFLRRYFDAIYEVTIRKGNSIILCLEISKKMDGFDKVVNECPHNTIYSTSKRIIGAIWLVPPSKSGGWECARNEDFMKSYEKYKLKKLDPESFQRMERYEDWEYENITKHVCATGIPMWNGPFAAMDPEYTGQGHGTLMGPACLRYLENHNPSKQKLRRQISENDKSDSQRYSQDIPTREQERMNKTSGSKIPMSCKSDFNCKYKFRNQETIESGPYISETCPPLFFALSHSHRSVNFYKKNGFFSVTDMIYPTEGMSELDSLSLKSESFNVNVLILDPFKTGKYDDITKCIKNSNVQILNSQTKATFNNFKIASG